MQWNMNYHTLSVVSNGLKIIFTSNFKLVLLLQFEFAGSLRSKPAEKRQRFTSPLPEREKLSTGTP